VEVGTGRYLMALAPGNDVRSLEIALVDLLEDLPEDDERERAILLELIGHLRLHRKKESVSMAELLFVSLRKASALASSGILHLAAF
jgi:hypothetical protein